MGRKTGQSETAIEAESGVLVVYTFSNATSFVIDSDAIVTAGSNEGMIAVGLAVGAVSTSFDGGGPANEFQENDASNNTDRAECRCTHS